MDIYINKNQKKMRCGFTTGTCCTLAAKAAAKQLLLGVRVEEETVMTPKGIPVTVEVVTDVVSEQEVIGKVYKDSGDDPDVTNGMEVLVSVSLAKTEKAYCFYNEEFPNIFLTGGIGVGRITKVGLEQNIGFPAINIVPRRMIMEQVSEIMKLADCKEEVWVTVILPEGKRLAKRTFNPQLGIEGGISVLGTSGIVEPMSEKALVATIETEIKQKQAEGVKNIILTPGNYGQSYVMEQLGLSLKNNVKCSNYVGEAIDLCISYGMENILLVGNIGKFVKLAAGIMNTHSKVADGRMELLALHTYLCGGTREMVDEILAMVNTEGVVERLIQWQLLEPVMESICGKINQHIKRRTAGQANIGVCVFSENHQLLGETEEVVFIKKMMK